MRLGRNRVRPEVRIECLVVVEGTEGDLDFLVAGVVEVYADGDRPLVLERLNVRDGGEDRFVVVVDGADCFAIDDPGIIGVGGR